MHTSSVSQAVAYRLLTHCMFITPPSSSPDAFQGGHDGFLEHAHRVADFYANRRNTYEALAHKHLDGLATWISPVAGMFLWLDLSPSGVKDSFDLIRNQALAKGVLAVPGYALVIMMSADCRVYAFVDSILMDGKAITLGCRSRLSTWRRMPRLG